MPSRDIKYLHPKLREKCLQFLSECKAAGLEAIITSTGRTIADQEALWAQGRKPLSVVNALRTEAGMAPITEVENRRKVTWTMKSKHMIDPATGFCSAFDFCLLKNGKAYWDVKISVDGDEIPDYEEAGQIAMNLGLTWGGSWVKNKDFPHCEMEA
jgi:peptidoglycan L-alanyl-D-glutamate endopeptidase CwlK